MVSRVDLHLHSTSSDGVFAPAEVVKKAGNLKLKFMSLTDHDCVDGLPQAIEAARNYPGLTVIPGVEVSTDYEGGDAHMLGYFIDYRSESFSSLLAGMRDSREERAQAIIQRLAE